MPLTSCFNRDLSPLLWHCYCHYPLVWRCLFLALYWMSTAQDGCWALSLRLSFSQTTLPPYSPVTPIFMLTIPLIQTLPNFSSSWLLLISICGLTPRFTASLRINSFNLVFYPPKNYSCLQPRSRLQNSLSLITALPPCLLQHQGRRSFSVPHRVSHAFHDFVWPFPLLSPVTSACSLHSAIACFNLAMSSILLTHLSHPLSMLASSLIPSPGSPSQFTISSCPLMHYRSCLRSSVPSLLLNQAALLFLPHLH